MGRGEYRNDRSKTNSVVITHENPPVELRNIFFCFLSFTSDRSDWKYYSVRMYRVRKIGRISLGPMLRFHWNFRGIRFFSLENFIEGSTGIGEQRWIYGIVMAAQVLLYLFSLIPRINGLMRCIFFLSYVRSKTV